ncbi:peptidylprolyl isomerase fpr4 [Orbilia blumenaviensis]|uniref:peptidylprolyl isomerase n=1 Tax=Orbilia blumenaviensis TaxID=1796055 RepID=A0AAV9VBX5_9PEZI
MSATPIRLWSLTVPATGEIVALEELGIPLNVSITMAAIDPTEEVKGDGPKLSTLKLLHQGMDEPDVDDFDDDESIDSDLASGEDNSEEESEEEEEKPKGKGKGKAAEKKDDKKKDDKKASKKASQEDDDEDEDDLLLEGSDDEEDDYEEVVVCTLDSTKTYQQPLQLTVGDGEPVFFKVTGSYTVYLTGNYVTEPRQLPPSYGGEESDEEEDMYSDEEDEEEGEDFDMEDEEELKELLRRLKSGEYDGVDADSDEESDDLDDVEDPRITELDDEEEEAPKLVKAKKPEEALSNKEKKAAAKAAQLKAKAAETAAKALSAKKRSADEMDIDVVASSETLPSGATVSTATATITATETPQSSLSKKQQKKLKANSGEPVAVSTPTEKKKVQFASQLEQGPTPNGNKSPATPAEKKAKDEKPTAQSSKSRTVDGVKIEDHKVGSGPEAKKGQKVSMRYIGKLTDGKVFDSNKKGKPFTFNLGKGDVIKGWDIGVAGMKVGGERKLVIPANLAYGNKALPGIPKNSTLVFEVKLLEIK